MVRVDGRDEKVGLWYVDVRVLVDWIVDNTLGVLNGWVGLLRA